MFILLADLHHASFLHGNHLSFRGRKKKKNLQLNFIFLYYLVISSHSGFSSRLPPNAGIVIPKYPQGIKDNLGKEERTELLKYVA